ncbi:MAG: M20/M25/M40 family metallo-hydrolase [Armatimonadetes bacterium]|nr:M20/M25/M40 family metallo-hydrolase [Armatimonadota bacterium]
MQFDGQRALEMVRRLTVEVGCRFAGTDNERRAAEFLRDEIASYGYADARLDPFPIDLYEVADERLEVEGLGEVPCEGLLGSEDAPDGVSGPLVYVEGGEECHLGEHCRGAILLVNAELGRKIEAIRRWQPAGVVVLETTPHLNPRRHNIGHEARRRFGTLPAVRVRHDVAERLLGFRGRSARLSLRSTYRESQAYNVMAELPGTTHPDEIVVVCGHMDSTYDGPGTLDNAAGTAVVWELARVFRQLGSRRTLRFIAFSGEEQGLRGSIHYAKRLRKEDKEAKKDKNFVATGGKTELDRHRLVVNIDVQGALIASNGAWITGPKDLGAAVRLLAAESGPFFTVHEACYSSDNAPLSDAGVPAVSFGRGGPNNFYGHTDGDVFELCSAEGLEISGRFIQEYIRRYIASPAMLPFPREIPDEHAEHVKNYFKERFMLRLDEGVED